MGSGHRLGTWAGAFPHDPFVEMRMNLDAYRIAS